MRAKSIFNGKPPNLSHIDGLVHFVNCVTKAMTTDENVDYIGTLKSRLKGEVSNGEAEKVAITSTRIFKALSPNSSLQHQAPSNRNQLVWNCFRYDQGVDRFVGSLKWTAPENSGAFIILVFTSKQANMYYYTGHICDIFGRQTERVGSSEELDLPRESDIDLSSIPVDRFHHYIESDTK